MFLGIYITYEANHNLMATSSVYNRFASKWRAIIYYCYYFISTAFTATLTRLRLFIHSTQEQSIYIYIHTYVNDWLCCHQPHYCLATNLLSQSIQAEITTTTNINYSYRVLNAAIAMCMDILIYDMAYGKEFCKNNLTIKDSRCPIADLQCTQFDWGFIQKISSTIE